MSTTRRIGVEVYGNVSGFVAAMNRVNSSVARTGQGLRGGGIQANFFQRQLMAIGTTARYALAGQLVFGIRSAVNNLAEFKSELGSINALAAQSTGSSGKLQGLGNELQQVGTEALLMSNKFGVATSDVETYMQRFFSSFNPPGTAKQKVAEMTAYTNAILNLTTALGSEAGDPQKLAGGLTGLINATPGGRKNPGLTAQHISDMFAQLLRETPALTGADIASASGRFAASKSLSAMTVQQMLAAFGVAAQTGGSPSVIVRGIAQLFGSSLLHPKTPANIGVYTQAGLPTNPNALAKLGGEHVLETLLNFVAPAGLKLTPEQLKKLNTGKPMAGISALSQSGDLTGVNLNAIYAMFGRQESVRQFVNILGQGGVKALKEFNSSLSDATKQNISAQMAQLRLKQSILTRAQFARQNLGIGLARAVQTPLEGVGLAEIAVSNFVAKHQTTTQVVGATAASLAALNALRKMGAFSRFGSGSSKFGKFLGGISSVERTAAATAITGEELSPGGSVLTGVGADGSRANPFWVIIAPLSWNLGGPSGSTGPSATNSAEKSVENKVKSLLGRIGEAAGGFVAGSKGKMILRTGAKYGKIGGPLAAVAGFFLSDGTKVTHPEYTNKLANSKHFSIIPNSTTKMLSQYGVSKDQEMAIWHAIQKAGLVNQFNGGLLHKIQLDGEAKADLVIRLVDAQGKTIVVDEKKGVPVKLWGAKGAPTTKGKPGSRKGAGV